jgi:hypothetical protein
MNRTRTLALRVLALIALPLAPAAWPAQALAYEDQLTVSAGAGYALAILESEPLHGAAFDLAVSVGLDPVWSLRGRAAYAVHPGDAPLHVVLLSPELLYMIDVVEVVPYFGLGLSALGRAWGAEFRPAAGVHAVLGLDYLASRAFGLGCDLRPGILVTDLDRHPFQLSFTLNAVWFFDA